MSLLFGRREYLRWEFFTLNLPWNHSWVPSALAYPLHVTWPFQQGWWYLIQTCNAKMQKGYIGRSKSVIPSLHRLHHWRLSAWFGKTNFGENSLRNMDHTCNKNPLPLHVHAWPIKQLDLTCMVHRKHLRSSLVFGEEELASDGDDSWPETSGEADAGTCLQPRIWVLVSLRAADFGMSS